MNTTASMHGASRIEIGGRRAASVDVAVGATIQCVKGRLWITQEGDTRDYCVPAGVTFCTDRNGRAVLSAIDETSVAIVRKSQSQSCTPGSLRIDSVERMVRAARSAQAAYIGTAFTRAAYWVLGRVEALFRTALRQRPRTESAC